MKIKSYPKGAIILETSHPCQKPHILLKGKEYKHCSYCDDWKLVTDFWAYNAHWDGLQCHCKDCVLKQNNLQYYKKKEGVNK